MIEELFEKFSEIVNLENKDQKDYSKGVFYAGVSMLFDKIKQLSDLPEEEAIAKFSEIEEELIIHYSQFNEN